MRLPRLPLTTLCLAVVTALTGCGGGGSSTAAPNGPTVQSITATTALAYYHYGYFTVTGAGLSAAGITLSDSTGKCQSPALRAGVISTDTTLAFQCALYGSGTISLDIKDSAGTVLGTQTFSVPDPKVRITTSLGSMDVLLNPTAAPVTVQNFMRYVTYTDVNNPTGYYSNTIFHRVIKNFMIQGGGFTTGLVQKSTFPAITLESNNGLKNVRGSIAMARTNTPDSATSQFFINHVNNTSLDYNPAVATPNGYAVFGSIVASDTASLSTLDTIAAVATQTVGAYANVPVTDVTITSITQIQ
jgi:peptidyl-prolyl cis-trans isomerase A (cyclophilin A)